MAMYNHKQVEKRWRQRWEESGAHTVKMDTDKPKFYCLDMFPYPSGSGLHVGHWRGYVLSDLWSRYKTLQGYQVLHPMGWDAFGLPAENDAIKKGIHPSISTEQNINNFKRQLREIGAMYDWSREINTTDEEYFRWTQWIFLKMYDRGLAYQREMPINFCPSCLTGLANEEVVAGACERCGTEVEKKNLKQWMLKITAYADRLLKSLDTLDWPEKVLRMQESWIGRSEGALIRFAVETGDQLEVFTTRPDTLFGATYMVLAPEHPLVDDLTTADQKDKVKTYREEAASKSSVERMSAKEKTGVFTGAYATNPVNDERIPIWISDYVLIDYGSGAIMAVPAHDDRDYQFAVKFDLPIRPVIAMPDGTVPELPFVMDGTMHNSGDFDGTPTEEGKEKVVAILAEKKLGESKVQFKMRDWVFSRQRYWGEPIPIVHCSSCGEVPVPEEELPVRLPDVERYQPTGTGESPLAAIESWVATTCPKCGGSAKRETNTMPQWAGSCWYFLRYTDPRATEAPASPEAIKYWMPVDLYVGGVEHAVLHLLYSRFYTMFLHDIGVVDFDEPFRRLFNQGMICKDGAKMSKSKGNVVNPDELVEHYGADALRMYELFIGPPEIDAEWMDGGIEGIHRFIQKVWNLAVRSVDGYATSSTEAEKRLHRLIQTVTDRVESFKLNTAVSAFMEFLNDSEQRLDKQSLETFVTLLAPMAPHLAEEVWALMGHSSSVFEATWPVADPSKLVEEEAVVAVQVKGKTRGTVTVSVNASEEEVMTAAMQLTAVSNAITDKVIRKVIYVPGRILNIVV